MAFEDDPSPVAFHSADSSCVECGMAVGALGEGAAVERVSALDEGGYRFCAGFNSLCVPIQCTVFLLRAFHGMTIARGDAGESI